MALNLEKIEEGRYLLQTLACPKCEQSEKVEITSEQLFALNQGAFYHTALPELPLETCERFISGYCPDCWNILFADED